MLTRCFPNSGRILAAQFSVLCTFPCTVLIFRLLPTTSDAGMNSLVLPYGFSLLCSGLLISWCARCLFGCCKLPGALLTVRKPVVHESADPNWGA